MIDEKKIEEAAINTSIEDTNEGRVREDYVISAMADHELGLQDGFKSGINWFKENLWHDASEEPKQDKRILTERKVVDVLIHEVHFTTSQTLTWDYLKKHYTTMTRWLYIEDLMKGGK